MRARTEFRNLSVRRAVAASVLLPGLAACGGSMQIASSSMPPSAPAPVSAVTVSCVPTAIAPDDSSQCSATVQGGSGDATVTWSANGGTINSSGLFTASASPGQAAVKATSVQDSTVSGTIGLTVAFMVAGSKHVVMVMEENQSYASVVGNTTDWPQLNSLIGKGALATNYYADSHPSIGNYFMLTTGQTLTNDDTSTQVWDVDNIARRMLAASVSFGVYAEGIRQGYLGGNTGLYLIRHNPFAMLADVAGNAQVAEQTILPFTQLAADLAANKLPEFSFIVPDVDDDAHDGTPLEADSWLQANVIEPLSTTAAFQPGGDGILIVDFDESLDSDTANGGGHVAPVLWGPQVKAGYQQTTTTVYQHESMLLTVMDALGLSDAPGAAANAAPMGEFFVQK